MDFLEDVLVCRVVFEEYVNSVVYYLFINLVYVTVD